MSVLIEELGAGTDYPLIFQLGFSLALLFVGQTGEVVGVVDLEGIAFAQLSLNFTSGSRNDDGVSQ